MTAEQLFQQAAALHQQGKLAEAVDGYRAALALRPDFVVAHYNLATALKALGDVEGAAASFGAAAAHKPDFVAAHFNLANTLRDLRRPDEAIAAYRKAIAQKPDFAEAHNNLGLVLQAQGRLDQAADCYRKAIAANASFADPHSHLGSVLDALGLADAAAASYVRALALGESPEVKANFVRCVGRRVFSRRDPAIARLVERALTENWAARGELVAVAASLVKTDPTIKACVARATKAWPQRLLADALFGATGLAALAGDSLLRALLETGPVGDVALERCLTMARAVLLDAAAAVVDDVPENLAFWCALARQCFLNDYVFACSDDELARIAALRGALAAAIAEGHSLPPLSLAAVGAYVPLHAIAGAERLLERQHPAPVAALLAQQIGEPAEEARLRAATPALTPIEDGVSTAVRQQYEENPYPRWTGVPAAGRTYAIGDYLRERFPLAPLEPFGGSGAVDVLVAGCGTGREAIAAAQQFPDARILALDLSFASLGYAQRKTRELGVANVEYAQADILRLGALERTFDAIVSVGVLHHLAKPSAGLAQLVSRLRPRGVVHLGFYSERARAAVVAARAFIAERGYAATVADIRRCRQELIDAGERFASIVASLDFHSASECRDLLFHVQEHRFTLAQIATLLDGESLVAIGMMVPPETSRRYAQRFPDDPAQTDLARWDAYEAEFPDAFGGMIKLWAQKLR
jgi:tetratricopeptide (TPR) repeat protein/2-polyprenyl-3-methyl-5-hydroxy-6-metoxy-1,4-benzoquinol methylase